MKKIKPKVNLQDFFTPVRQPCNQELRVCLMLNFLLNWEPVGANTNQLSVPEYEVTEYGVMPAIINTIVTELSYSVN